MAVISPIGLLGTRSPILITWDASNRDSITGFNLEIYAWTGDKDVRPASPIYTINRTSGFVDFFPTADISKLLENEFVNRTSKLDTDDLVTMSPDSLIWVEVDYTLDWFNTESAPLGAGTDTGTTTRFLAVYGYSDFVDGANKDISTAILMKDQEKYFYEFDTYNMPIYLGDVGSSYQTDVVKIKMVGSDATNDEVSVTIQAGEDAEDRVLLFPVGIPNLSNYIESESLGITEPRLLDWWDIQILDSSDAVVDSRRFYNQCEIKYDPIQLQFVNRYGMWDTLTFFKRSDDSINLTKSQYKSVVGSASASGYSWDTESRGSRSFNHEVIKSIVLNTGLVKESLSGTIQDLMMSEYVLMTINRTTARVADRYTISQDFRSVIVNTESLRLQKHINDKTINYTLEVSFATAQNGML